MKLIVAKKIKFSIANCRLNWFIVFAFCFITKIANGQGIVINEISQGTSGSQEYVEFLVTGPNLVNCNDTPPCIDLRGYIFDDNNGYLNGAPTAGVGIAAGACRFSQDAIWACIPAGTLIVIYNDADVNGSIPPQDFSMSDGNCMMTLPISSALFEKHATLPSSLNSSYSTTGWISGGSWTNISMANAADGFQIYSPSNTTVPVFSVGWGTANNLGDIFMGSASAAGRVFYASDCNYFNQASWINGAATTDQTPGFLNAGQGGCVGLMNASCNPPTIVLNATDEICLGDCDGTITATISGGTSPFLLVWSPAPGVGQGTANATNLCPGNYTLTLTNDNGASCILTDNITVNSGVACCAMTNTVASTNETCDGLNDGSITLTETGGIAPVTFSIDGGITNQASGNFTNLAPGSYDILIEDGSGCQFIDVVVISAGTLPVTPTFNAIGPFCNGDAIGALPTTSLNGINGTWSPAINNTATTNYLFTIVAGQCAINTNLTIVVNPVFASAENISVCENTNHIFPDGFAQVITANTSHVSNLIAQNGCDSIVTTNVTMITSFATSENFSVCENSSVTYPDGSNQIITANTSHISNLVSADGCDSIVTTNITMLTAFSMTENISVCTNTNYVFPDGTNQLIIANTSYSSNLLSVGGCDSIITTNITAVNNFASTENINICSGDNFVFPDGTTHVNITLNETYISTLASINGCDSLVTTNLNVNANYGLAENFVVCEGTVFSFPDGTNQTINSAVIYISNLLTAAGCDSIITTNVSVNATYNLTENFIVCPNTNFIFPDGTSQNIIANTSYASNLLTINGCDSIITTNIQVNPDFNVIENVTVCDNENYVFPDGTNQIIIANISHQSIFVSVNGCDSIITTNITMQTLPLVNAGSDVTICTGDTYTLNATGAQNYNWSNGLSNGSIFTPLSNQTITVIGTDNFGCQNTDDVVVTVNNAASPTIAVDITSGCAPLNVVFENTTIGSVSCAWNFNDGNPVVFGNQINQTFNNSGLYDVSVVITDNAGCVSMLNLTDYIEVFNKPIASFSPSTFYINDLNNEVIFTNQSIGADQYQWSFGDAGPTSIQENPIHIYNAENTANNYLVQLIATSNNTCADTVYALIQIEESLIVYVPNVFTPDGDEYNEFFTPVFTSGFDPYDYHLMIFNRYGEIVFESYNAAIGWDGTYGNQGLVLDDVYIWKIDFKRSNSDERVELVGHVTVLK